MCFLDANANASVCVVLSNCICSIFKTYGSQSVDMSVAAAVFASNGVVMMQHLTVVATFAASAASG